VVERFRRYYSCDACCGEWVSAVGVAIKYTVPGIGPNAAYYSEKAEGAVATLGRIARELVGG